LSQEKSGGQPKVALVHDFLLDVRGAERTFAEICKVWPQADVFTAVYDREGTEGWFTNRRVHTSFLQRLHPNSKTFRGLLPLYPYAIERLDLRGYDLVISSSSAWAHGVIVDDQATHVCYCYNPFRYAWNDRNHALSSRGLLSRMALGVILSRWRQWDWIAAQRVDRYVAISKTTQDRIKRYWGRDSDIVNPPVQTSRFNCAESDDYYMVLSELMSHKRLDVAIEAFNRLGLPLIVVGDGPEWRTLKRAAKSNIVFKGRCHDDEVSQLLSRSKGLVVVAQEEFGIAAVEAQAAGKPVVAYGRGGVLETVVEGETGVFFSEQTPESLARCIAEFDPSSIDPNTCMANAERFSSQAFRSSFKQLVDQVAAGSSSVDHRYRLPLRMRRRGSSSGASIGTKGR